MRRLLGMLCAFVVVLMLGFSNQALAEDEVKNQEATNTKMTSTNNAVSQTVEANALSCNHDPLAPEVKDCPYHKQQQDPNGQAKTLDHRVVRVGVYDLPGYHSCDVSGACTGYEIDYLNRISNVTGWEYDYVPAPSWSDLLVMLKEKKVDLISPAQMTAKRMEEFNFSIFPIGKVYCVVMTLKDSSFVFEDFAVFNKMTFGVEEGNTYYKMFLEYAQKKHFTPKNIKTYPNHQALVTALNQGEVDAIICNVMRAEPDMRQIGRVGTAIYYFMHRKEDTYLKEGLTEALDLISSNEPNLGNELNRINFPFFESVPLSRAELDYIKELPEIRIAMPKDERPVAYLDPETGEVTGILVDYLNLAGDAVGLKFRFIPSTRHEITSEASLHLLVESGLSPLPKIRDGNIFTNNIIESQMVLVGRSDLFFVHGQHLTLGRASFNKFRPGIVRKLIPNISWKVYDKTVQCLEAVRTSQIDGCLINQFAISWYLAMPKYENLTILSKATFPYSICLKTANSRNNSLVEDQTFVSILNKSFNHISPEEFQEIVIRYTTGMPYKMTHLQILARYWYVIALVILMLGALGLYARSKNYRAQRDGLTGLFNRSYTKGFIENDIKRNAPSRGVMLLLDLDHFKKVNDTFGHQEGDRILIETATILQQNCRASDVACRLGGDEFIIYLLNTERNARIEQLLQNLKRRLERVVEVNGQSVKISSCIGVVEVPRDGSTFEELYKHADEALYACKSSGRNCFRFFSDNYDYMT